MPPQEATAFRTVAGGPASHPSSTSGEHQETLGAAGTRKRSASQLSNVSGDGGIGGGRPSHFTKKQKAPSEALLTKADSDGSGADDVLNVDAPASNAGATADDKRCKISIDTSFRPISDVREMFEDMVKRLEPNEMAESPIKLNVATLCSGTDAPIFALSMIQEALHEMNFSACFEFEHSFSCEIEPFKQGFIRRNLPHGTLVFRDVIEMANAGLAGEATTAGGSKAKIPASGLDILFAGCSCVDYSNMNQNKPTGSVPSLDRHLKAQPKRRGRSKNNPGDGQESAPVGLDEAFIRDLDAGLAELLRLSNSESAMTFFAAVKLISILRPRFVVLENVYSAPWDMYTGQIFPKVGYVARDAKLDSKDFYLPQTRQRGYLVAIDAMHFGEEQATRIAAEWEAQLLKCRRPPSASISSFLRPADDPATIQARADMESKAVYSGEWALSSLRHADARYKNGLRRDDNPFSKKAMRNGKLIFATYPSHSWMRFWATQPARVIDLMDITFAVSHKAGVDLAYKTSMLDVSQNVDRNNVITSGSTASRLKKNLGIVGCITPCGLPIVTDMMRPITGTETLALQGLPVDELVISTETQAQLRDLAGNAMTVTVVGAATLALLLSVPKTGTDRRLMNRTESATLRHGLYTEPACHEWLAAGRASGATPGLDLLLGVAGGMARMCHCPLRPTEVSVCNACGITACSACRGNPKHDFYTKTIAKPSRTLEQDRVRLQNMMPMTIRLHADLEAVFQTLGLVDDKLSPYSSLVYEILGSGLVYYFDEIRVTEVVTVCYRAKHSIARLVLSAGSDCGWYVYIAPWHPGRAQLSGIFELEQPVARGTLVSNSIEAVDWSVWVLGHIGLTLNLTRNASGVLVAGGLSFDSGYDASEDPSLLRWKNSVEGRVSGAYLHHPDCGTAGNALHIKQSATAADKVFMMWDSGGLRDPSHDHFVWTNEARRMEPHEYREVLLHASPALPWDLNSDLGLVRVSWPGYWSAVPPPGKIPDADMPAQPPKVSSHISWGFTETVQRATCHADGQTPLAGMPVLAAITASLRSFPLLIARLSKIDASRTSDSLCIIPPTGRDGFLRVFSHLSGELCGSRAPRDVSLFPHLNGEWVPVAPCRDCSVTPPEVTVHEKKDQRKAAQGQLKFVKAVIEDPDEAALFERHFQDLPNALAVAARLLHHDNEKSTVDIKIMLQPKTLASRALAYLKQAHSAASRGSLALVSHATTAFTVMLDYAAPSTTEFVPFGDSVLPCDKDYLLGIDPSHGFAVPGCGPPRFRRETRSQRRTSSVLHELRPSQKIAVDWMLQRERAPLDFVKSEIEEEVVAPLNMRVAGKAEWANRFPYSARGGVVAHEIGYGKTVVTLALLDYMREYDTNESIAERMEKVDGAWAQELPAPFEHLGDVGGAASGLRAESFFIHLSATLIVVPKHITDQWASEVSKFLGLPKPKVHVIKTVQAFYGKSSLKTLQEAEIIIISSAVFGQAFLDRLQSVTGRGSEAPKALPGRTREAWYRGALRHCRILTSCFLAGRAAGVEEDELVEKLNRDGLPGLIRKQQADIDALVQKQVPEIDRQIYKKAARKTVGPAGDNGPENEDREEDRENAEAGQQQNATRQGAISEALSWNVASLHNCSFARIVWDECSYDDDESIHLFVANAVANAKWLISGTPKLFALENVCNIAAAFGVHIARPEPRMLPSLPPVTNGPTLKPMSKSEEFHVFSSRVKSAALAHERHNQAHKFVAAYFRANALDDEIDIDVEEHVIPIDMASTTAARYHLVNQELLDAGYDFTALPAHARQAVALKGADLLGRDGSAAAKMLLGLLACGLGELETSTGAQQTALARRSDVLGDQMKLLWDKTMWLWRWIDELMADDEGYRISEPVLNSMKRVEALCDSLRQALVGDGNFEEFGGREMFHREAALVAGVPGEQHRGALRGTHPAIDSLDFLKATWGHHFEEGWLKRYHKNKALFTWLDFFSLENSNMSRLSEKQLRLLAEDICWLRYKIDPGAPPLKGSLPGVDFLRESSVRPISKTSARAVPSTIEKFAESDKRVLDNLDGAELEQWVRACAQELSGTRKSWEKSKGTFKFATPPDKKVKVALQERLTELNLKFLASHSVDHLKKMIWLHENGLSAWEHYRDGRAPPDRHRDLELATGWGASTAKQVEATNEELKRAMVHLAKTIEDLRATRLEARFTPEYTSLAGAEDKDVFVQKKSCCNCRRTLRCASSSFLVVACGHFLCGECKTTAGFYCPVQDCPAFIRKRPVLQCSQAPSPTGVQPLPKAESVAGFIKSTVPADEFVVVFAQYRPLVDALAGAFRRAGLRCVNLAATKDHLIARDLENFKAGKAGQILLLDMDSETSAGSNLTNATRIVFASPYVHHDEQHQTRTVRQARGRCIRTGQTRKVHVYHFMVRGTIEEETLRKYASGCPRVQRFFDETSDRIPWWMDGPANDSA